ncbi:MAG TPA: TonB-dependent receptor [Prolixibacteraceae bacterium]|nr:TonB-dependent receptor [Prolixibacteraceae bacterium]
MKYSFASMFIIVYFALFANAQGNMALSGFVYDEHHKTLPGATVALMPINKNVSTDQNGFFSFSNLNSGKYKLEVSFIGYEKYIVEFEFNQHLELDIHLSPSMVNLNEVVVADSYAEQRKMTESLNIEVINNDFIRQNQGNSLMKSLERLPGISVIDIGAGQSKPLIRGLGFNRVVVLENGIRHEGQQWGADHGLEIDQYAAGRVEIIRGPSSLRYGSDAIGGVIDVKHNEILANKKLGGTVELSAKSNNSYGGGSILLFGRSNKIWFSMRATLTRFADYRVPTDSIDIYSYRAPLYKNRMRNTAGKENNFHVTLGFDGKKVSSKLITSIVGSKNGFFANAHGLEPRMVDALLHDMSNRDFQYPYQTVSHIKVISLNEVRTNKYDWDFELAFQQNYRQEWSQYVNHGFMPAIFPNNMPFSSELERAFRKNILTGNINLKTNITPKSILYAGLSNEYQMNRIDGRGFIIPEYEQINMGAYTYFKYNLFEKTLLHAGLRADYGRINIDDYYDWFKSPVLNNTDTLWINLQRAVQLDRSFTSLTWSAGINHQFDYLKLKANIGKSFRMPLANELAANGINYHRFSFERGNQSLAPEISYQIDFGAEWHSSLFAFEITPFVSFSPNYIYLNPTHLHDRLYGNGHQVFEYTQNAVLRYGGEVHAHLQPVKTFQFGLIGNYLYAVQTSGNKKGFSLPYSPPASVLLNVKYNLQKLWVLYLPYFSADLNLVAKQNRVVPPEEKTPGYQLVNLSIGANITQKPNAVSLVFQVQNMFDIKYFKHTSFYRLINVPEPGRNFIISLSIPIRN